MKVLVIGGTRFIGRHLVEKLLAAEHQLTLLNRGQTAPELFPNLPLIRADRDSDLKNIKELTQDWDAVIDLSAYFPRQVGGLLEILKGRAGRYVLCSTVSAYVASAMDRPTPIIDEDSPLHECTPQDAVDTSLTKYGQRKAECERIAMGQHPSGVPVTVIRPSIVYGAHDHTDRFAYWIWRASQEKTFLLPDDGLTVTRRTYAPDLASAFVACLKSPHALGKAYNIAETDPLSFRDTLFLIGNHLGKKPLDDAVSVPSDWLLKADVKPWTDLPLWIPRTNLQIDTYRSRRDLSFVSTPSHLALAHATDSFLAENREPRAGLTQKSETELLAKFHNQE